MSAQSTAIQALEEARAVKTSRREQVYRDQVRLYRPAARTAFRTVISPWWAAFAASPEAAQIRRWLGVTGRRRVAIADPVRYAGPNESEWEATVMLEPGPFPRDLQLCVQQLRGGRPVRSFGGALLAHHMRRAIPEEIGGLRTLDLHPIVLIDFAEQLEAGTVQAHVQALVAGS
ncbi:MAG: hypothetical protein JXN59_02710 [Anaerolineae bacterium]|nr:hypothetical protein [Anaerolineae bacterium]